MNDYLDCPECPVCGASIYANEDACADCEEKEAIRRAVLTTPDDGYLRTLRTDYGLTMDEAREAHRLECIVACAIEEGLRTPQANRALDDLFRAGAQALAA